MKQFRITYFILLISLVVGCEEAIDHPIEPMSSNVLVVEGVFTNEKLNHRVTLSHPYSEQNGDPIPAINALVAIVDPDNNFEWLTENPSGSGEYFTDPIRAFFGKTYILYIQYRGEEYLGADRPPAGQLLEPLELNAITDSLNTLYSIKFPEIPNNSAYYTVYDLDWSNTNFCGTQIDECIAKQIYYDLNTLDVQAINAPEKEILTFPNGTSIKRHKYFISDNYRQYLRSLLSETEWRGGLFDIERDNLPTNMNNGAIGFFAVATVVSDSILVNE